MAAILVIYVSKHLGNKLYLYVCFIIHFSYFDFLATVYFSYNEI